MSVPRYEHIGHGYAHVRREDPRLAARIHAALGDARTVVNVGAGAGSYEPRDRHVIAIEPSDVMAAQRPPDRVPAIRASAGALPLRDRSVDAAMAVLTVHHWDTEREAGVRELRRVGAFWAHPERVLDPDARAATSGFARMPAEVVARVVDAVGHDLDSGAWDVRYGGLRGLDSYDAGLRLVINCG